LRRSSASRPLGEIRRAYEVAEHDGELAALGLGGLWCRGGFRRGFGGSGRGLRRRGFGPGGADPRQDLALASRDLLHVHQLLDQLVEGFVIELELALQGPERDAAVLVEVRLGSDHRV
jgi:hypothetical protein